MNENCKEYTGIVARIKELENKVSELWKKWNRMQMWLVGILSALIMNLLGVILILIKA